MPGCHNCGRETARTEDWACQWCGYPLLSGNYKKLDKTYRQLQEEIRQQPLELEETGTTIQAEDIPPPVLAVETEPEQESEPEEVEKSKPEPEPVAEIRTESEPQPEEAEESKPELPEDTGPGPAKPVIELTVDQLISDYAEDANAADAKYSGRLLEVSGVASRVEVNDTMDVRYIVLVSTNQEQLQSIRCVFDKKYGPEMNRLEKGQKVTIQGIYEGSLIDFRMKDCVIVA
ncbi:MAG: hypothetical protein KAI14_04470 [Dehalococcoidales bacterium]|nr:hypothetical protein [Dehalococcoidales bacterium]